MKFYYTYVYPAIGQLFCAYMVGGCSEQTYQLGLFQLWYLNLWVYLFGSGESLGACIGCLANAGRDAWRRDVLVLQESD